MNKKITLTLTEKEYQDIVNAASEKTLRPATFCKMIVVEVLKKNEQELKSRKQFYKANVS